MRKTQTFELQWQDLPETPMPNYVGSSINESSEISYQVITSSYEVSPLQLSYKKTTSIALQRPTISGYSPRIFYQKDVYHKFPFSFDKQIINEGQFFKMENGGLYFVAPGYINENNGFYTIGINYSTGNVYHRCFYKFNDFYRQFK